MSHYEMKEQQQRKEREIINLLKAANYSETLFEDMKSDNAIVISPPIEEFYMELMTYNSRGNAYSIKPGNIVLNISKLMYSVPAAVIASAGINEDNYVLKVAAFLVIWKELRDCFTIEITNDEANVMIALWRTCNYNHKISISEGFIATNNYLISKHQDELNKYEYQKVLDSLIKIESIEVTDDMIWLREWISKRYR